MNNTSESHAGSSHELRDLALRNATRAKDPTRFEYAVALGDRVRDAREERGMTRMELALASGIGDRPIRLLEHGLLAVEEVEDEMIEALAQGLQIDPDNLFYAASPEPAPDWGQTIRTWGRGFLNYASGAWSWSPIPGPGLVPVSSGSQTLAQQLSVELLEPARNVLRVQAGSDYENGRALLLQLRTDRQEFEPIAEIVLDAQGTGMIELPDGGLRLVLTVTPPGRAQ